MGLARVRGVFHRFDGELEVTGDGTLRASGTVDEGSLDTRLPARDEHLRSSDFFDVAHHRRITFATTAVEPAGEDRLRIAGELTIGGVTRTIELDAEVLGTGLDDAGAERVGLEARARIDRRDFGLTWNSLVDGGIPLVGSTVDLQFEISAVRRG